ncbi:hypothetical protein [Streptomyces sp. NPDC058572]|uniref:hypothetical protein n=1 Tax=Streptomyces sp. NPDC058572 TaxID=3346546 RepID=UPI003660B6A7
MLYNFLTVHPTPPPAMAAALAGAVGVEPSAVDVADEETDPEERDWDAPVLCAHHPVLGDVSVSWDVYVSESVAGPPAEAEAALAVALSTGTTVLYPAEGIRPSAYWAAAPDGTVTRVRVLEEDGEEEDDGPFTLTVQASEAPLAQLPSAVVMLLPEVYRDEELPTELADSLPAADRDSPEERARVLLGRWERLVRRAASDWAPSGNYPQELYLQDLERRDELADALAVCPADLRTPFDEAAHLLDDVFRAHTEDDAGRLTGSPGSRAWWWHRRPDRVPWDGYQN